MIERNEFNYDGLVYEVTKFISEKNFKVTTVMVMTTESYQNFDKEVIVPIKFFNQLADTAALLKPNDEVKISGKLSGREYNGKFYLDAVGRTLDCATLPKQEKKVVKTVRPAGTEKPVQPLNSQEDIDALPF